VKGYYRTNLYAYDEHIVEDETKKKKMITIRIHRLVAETFLPNIDNKPVVDHINRNPLDNRVVNLRWATLSENGVNSKNWSTNTSGVKGVSFVPSRNKFQATIQFNGKKKFIGYYDSLEKASDKREEYEKKLFGEFNPNLN